MSTASKYSMQGLTGKWKAVCTARGCKFKTRIYNATKEGLNEMDSLTDGHVSSTGHTVDIRKVGGEKVN